VIGLIGIANDVMCKKCIHLQATCQAASGPQREITDTRIRMHTKTVGYCQSKSVSDARQAPPCYQLGGISVWNDVMRRGCRAREAIKEAIRNAPRADLELCEHGRRAEAALISCFEVNQVAPLVARQGSRKALSVLTSLK
jgi:hypothetical protein